ncbi:ABC transporter substrate-binding protein/permease [Hutsoniella sourekii]|uniref:ABC transporter substrate-binding protein/permease n=1 Tax=Hutsoniella sourekii TaxID=87650 RepID=UPI0004B09122|nr:ABC transporter substrate-binding protein/permease [Hutsoniella sourekii]
MKNRIKGIFQAIALIALVLSVNMLKVQAAQEVTVAVSAQSKPYNYHNDKQELTGFEIDLLKEIDQRLDAYQFNYETTEFASLFAGLDAGKFDLIANNIGDKEERREKYLFSQYPYVITHNVLITKPELGEKVDLTDLAGRSMGIVAGSAQSIFMEAYNKANPDKAVRLDYVDTDASTIIRGVESGQYDATIYSTTYLKDVEDTYGIKLKGHPIANEDEIQPPGAYFLYRKDNQESLQLRDAIDQVLAEMREDGSLKELSEKYFGQDDSQLSKEIMDYNDSLAQADQSSARKVIVGTSGQTKPLNYFTEDTNQLTGIEVDILNEIDRRLDEITIDYEITEFASLFAGLDSQAFDLVANNLGENPERREKFLFSLYPYIITHNVVITQTGTPENMKMEDFTGKSFGVVPASPQSMFLEKWNEDHPDQAVDIQYVDSDPSTIIRDVYNGRFDATIYNTTYLNDVQDTFGIKLQSHAIENEDAIRPPGSYFIYRKDDQDLRNLMDQTLAEMRADGTLAAISEKYLGEDHTQLTPEIIEKNDKIEAERTGQENSRESSDLVSSEAKSSTDGKLFAPEVIGQIMPTILSKLPITLLMTLVSALIGLSLGFIIAITKIRGVPVLSQLFNVFVSFMRGTPQLVQLFLAFYGFPLVVRWLNQQFGWTFDVNNIPALTYVFIAFGLNEAAYNSETFRAAILSVDQSEVEAAKSIGLTSSQTMRRIILPSALIVAIPNLGNSLISLLKGTSLAFTVTIIDIMGQARIIAGSNLRFFEAYIAVALIYWICCILIEQAVKWLEGRLNVDNHELEDIRVEEASHA